jgi:hypothetical protein|tara:strand:- start:282 stop:650 length:369 start_codon:yes stop_codon:yes gene_type:complete
MEMKILAPLALLCSLLATPSYAFETSGHDLFSQLEDYYIEKGMTDKELLNAGMAYGYISAIFDSHRENFTIPADVKPTRLVATVYKFLIDNPNLRYKKANILVLQAISESFPLEEEETKKDG